MKNTTSSVQQELDQKRQAYENAKRVRKRAKNALKSSKQTYKQALEAEKEAKKAYKAIRKILVQMEPAAEVQEETASYARPVAEVPKAPAVRKPAAKPPSTGKPVQSRASTRPSVKKSPGDDLTKVKGVGDKVAAMLRANGIRTFADMAALDAAQYKQLLRANDMSKYRNPSDWARDAAILAESGAVAEKPAPSVPLRKSGKTLPAAEQPAPPPPPPPPAPEQEPEETLPAAEPPAPAVVAEEQAAVAPPPAPKPARPRPPSKKSDDLTKIAGVGDKVAEMLKANGIRTFAAMAAMSVEDIKALLKANRMSQYRNPTTWVDQAALLATADTRPSKEKAPSKKTPANQPPAKEEANEQEKED